MAAYTGIASVGRSIERLLDETFERELPASPRRPRAVLIRSDDFTASGTDTRVVPPAVSVFCYRISLDRETRAGLSGLSARDGVVRLPVCLHVLLTAWADSAEQELELLGKAMQTLETHSVLTGPLLEPGGDWAAGEAVQVVFDDVALDTVSHAFESLTAEYRLSVPYVVRSIRLETRPRTETETVVTTYGGVGALADGGAGSPGVGA